MPGQVKEGVQTVDYILLLGLGLALEPEYAVEVVIHPLSQAGGQNGLAYPPETVDYGGSFDVGHESSLNQAQFSLPPYKPFLYHLHVPQHGGFQKELGCRGFDLAYVQTMRVEHVKHGRGEIDFISVLDVPHGYASLS